MEPATVHAALPVEIVALEEAGRIALAAAAQAESWTTRQRQEVLVAAERVTAILTALKGRVLTAEQDAGTWALHGERDLAAWAGRVTKQGRGGGCAQVGQAATLAAMPTVADALVDGPVTAGHLQQLTKATTASPTLAAYLGTREGQAGVVELARRLDAASFGKHLAHQAARLDPASQQRTFDEQRANRSLLLTHGRGGTLIKGQVDSVVGHRFQLALDALNPRPAADDDRSRAQSQSDALDVMSEAILADKRTTPGAIVPPQILITITQDTWTALRTPTPGGDGVGADDANADDGAHGAGADGVGAGFGVGRAPGPGSTRDVLSRLVGVTPVCDEDGHVLPASEVARLLCDCTLTRLLVDARGLPLDVGRDHRLFTPAQRRAVRARDGATCAYPGCQIPFRYVELHHITWWDRDTGPTNLDNAFPGCRYHHQYIHDHDLHITRNSHGQYVLQQPDGRLIPGSAQPDPPAAAEPCPAPGRSEAEPCLPADVRFEADPYLADDDGWRDPNPPPPEEQLLLWTA